MGGKKEQVRLIPRNQSFRQVRMSQSADLIYGFQRENVNHPRIEKHLGCKLMKLPAYHTMDWIEIGKAGDESPPWNVEQKSRKCSYEFLNNTYSYNGKRTCLIGKNKIDYMKNNGGNGIVYFDFTDKLMYWVFDEDQYKNCDIEEKFVRGSRNDCIDKACPVVHIPCEFLKECLTN